MSRLTFEILILGKFWIHPLAMQSQQAEIIDSHIADLFKICSQLVSMH
jgi:hypothetical protein